MCATSTCQLIGKTKNQGSCKAHGFLLLMSAHASIPGIRSGFSSVFDGKTWNFTCRMLWTVEDLATRLEGGAFFFEAKESANWHTWQLKLAAFSAVQGSCRSSAALNITLGQDTGIVSPLQLLLYLCIWGFLLTRNEQLDRTFTGPINCFKASYNSMRNIVLNLLVSSSNVGRSRSQF